MERSFAVDNEIAAFKNKLLRKEVEYLREQDKKKLQVQIAVSEQLKEAKYQRDVWKALAAYDSKILHRFFDRDGFEVDLGCSVIGNEQVQNKMQTEMTTKETAVESQEIKKMCAFFAVLRMLERMVEKGLYAELVTKHSNLECLRMLKL